MVGRDVARPRLAPRWLGAAALLGVCACAPQGMAPIVDRSGGGVANPQAVSGTYVVRKNDTLYSIAWRHNLDYKALAAANGVAPPGYVIHPGQRLRLAQARAIAPPSAPPTPVTTTSVEFDGAAESGGTVKPGGGKAGTGRAAVNAPAVTPPVPAPAQSDLPPVSNPPPVANPPPVSSPPPIADPPAVATSPSPPPTPPSSRSPPRPVAANPPARGRARAGWQSPVDAKPVRRFGARSKGLVYELASDTRIRAAASGMVVYAGAGLGGFRHLVIVKSEDDRLVAYSVNVQPNLREGERVRAGALLAEIKGTAKTAGRFHFEIRQNGKPVDPAPLIGV